MGTLGGFPYLPAMVRGERSSPAPHAIDLGICGQLGGDFDLSHSGSHWFMGGRGADWQKRKFGKLGLLVWLGSCGILNELKSGFPRPAILRRPSMPRLSRCTLLALLFVGGCAMTPAGGENGGSGGTRRHPASKGGGPASSGGSTASSGGARGGAGGGSAASSGGTTAAACTPGDPTNLVSGSTWICDATTPVQIEGSFYSYGDGSSCTTPSPLTARRRQAAA